VGAMDRTKALAACTALTLVALTLVASNAGATDASTTSQNDFPRENFSSSTTIDNVWVPLAPGTRLTYKGEVVSGTTRTKHSVVVTVTSLVKVVDGVPTVVVWDRDFDNGELQESELAFEAQDADGNVWNLGEYPEEYEDGVLAGAPSTWLSGVRGARAGLLMRGDPRPGTPEYVQGSSPTIRFLDVATVVRTDANACAQIGCFDHVLQTDESSPLEPDSGHQVKYYARGIGNLRVEAVGGADQETLVLAKVEHLNAKTLAAETAGALALDARAYSVAADVYGKTAPAYIP
jgi:hypothetical protein